MTAAERLSGAGIALLDEPFDSGLRIFQFMLGAEAGEDLQELLLGWSPHQHLVLDTAQKGLVAQFVRLEVGGEYQEGFKGHGHLAPGAKAEEVHPPLHRNDPAVENLRRRRPLTSKVVDQVGSVGRLELER